MNLCHELRTVGFRAINETPLVTNLTVKDLERRPGQIKECLTMRERFGL